MKSRSVHLNSSTTLKNTAVRVFEAQCNIEERALRDSFNERWVTLFSAVQFSPK